MRPAGPLLKLISKNPAGPILKGFQIYTKEPAGPLLKLISKEPVMSTEPLRPCNIPYFYFYTKGVRSHSEAPTSYGVPRLKGTRPITPASSSQITPTWPDPPVHCHPATSSCQLHDVNVAAATKNYDQPPRKNEKNLFHY